VRQIIIYGTLALLLLVSCGDMNPLGHHRQGHAGGGDDACPPGHERRGLCEVAPDPDPDPPVVVVDSVTFDPPGLAVEVGAELEFHVALWSGERPHFCVVLDGVAGLLEASLELGGWYWVEGAEHRPWPCDGMEVAAEDPEIAEIIWSPHVMDDLPAAQFLRVAPVGRVSA
jgi:hypothetical protein